MAFYTSSFQANFTQADWLPMPTIGTITYDQSGSNFTSFTVDTGLYSWTINGGFFYQPSNQTVDGTITSYYLDTSTVEKAVHLLGTDFQISTRDALAAQGDYIGIAGLAFSGHDFITGSNYDDLMLGFSGNDVIYGDASTTGGAGDILLGNAGGDTIYGYGGADSIVGGSDLIDTLDTGDQLFGGDGNDHIYGSSGDDLIYGEAGADLIVGGADQDILSGGDGNDIFVNILGTGHDTITDFSNGDIITIQRTDVISDYASVVQNMAQQGADTVIAIDVGSSVRLSGVDVSSLGEGDFFFYG